MSMAGHLYHFATYMYMYMYVNVCGKFVHCFVFVCRQKVTISKLQQDVHESEAKLHHLMVAQVHEHGGSALEARLQVHICDVHTPTCIYRLHRPCNSSKTKRAALSRIQTYMYMLGRCSYQLYYMYYQAWLVQITSNTKQSKVRVHVQCISTTVVVRNVCFNGVM